MYSTMKFKPLKNTLEVYCEKKCTSSTLHLNEINGWVMGSILDVYFFSQYISSILLPESQNKQTGSILKVYNPGK